MKAALVVLAFLPFMAQAGVEHKGGAQQAAAHARSSVVHESMFDKLRKSRDHMARFFERHARPKPGRCSV